MAHVVARLEDYADTLAHEMHHPLLGSPTISVGVIEGGEAVNIVPDRCWIEIDRRTLPGETAASVVSPVRDLLREVSRWEFEPPHLSVAGMEVPQDSPVVRILSEAICRSGQDVTVEVAHYATDAGVYNTEGIPAVVFGPGDIAQAHTNDEFIEVDQLDRAVRIITTLIS
jgi:acetylornithine deacetylase